MAELVNAKANSYVEASLNKTFLSSWFALAAGTRAYRFESCPDYKKNKDMKIECMWHTLSDADQWYNFKEWWFELGISYQRTEYLTTKHVFAISLAVFSIYVRW